MWELRSKTYWIYKELASHHLQQSSCWDLVFLPQQWTRSKHGRELLMDKIDTKLMRKLKNQKYIVNMWKTLVEAKLVFGSLIRDLGPESAGSSRNMVTFSPLLQL
ncbi:hypothetical protein SELMODRAFT_431834 [Selaginella moellendorffii]|uniref:Uncharacterized protein n=1 Tax=Selaginella moellendorffii TaxID=88036 RepID=D8TDY5_SELML|nr:hypothetical protein SELMODRAFT_431834 [Selaginella moellendorffii]